MKRGAILFALAVLLLLASVASAQPGRGASTTLPSTALGTGSAGYDLSWWTVDGGGVTFRTGGKYSLSGTIGQPDAALAPSGSGYTLLIGGNYALVGGFWGGAVALQHRIYLPLVLRNA